MKNEIPSDADEIIGNWICLFIFCSGFLNIFSFSIWMIADTLGINKDPNSNWWWRLMGGIVCFALYQIIIEIRKIKKL